jgi:adenylate cyclase
MGIMDKDNNSHSKTDIAITDQNASEIKIALPFLRHISIESKLKFGFGILFFIIFLTSVLSIFGLEYVRGHFEYAVDHGYNLETLSLDAEKELLKARLYEKDFLLTWRKIGIEKAKEKYLKGNQKSIQMVRQKLKEIVEVLPQGDGANGRVLQENMRLLNDELEIYEKDFKELIDLIEEVGFYDSGLVGHFREDAHNVEKSLLKHHLITAEVDLLLLRRHEKDYLLRGDKKYIKKVSDAVLILKQEVAKSALVVADKKLLAGLFDDYWNTFDQLTTDQEKLIRLEDEFKFLAHEIELATESFREMGHAEAGKHLLAAEEGTDRTEILVYFTVISLLVAGFTLAYLLASHIRTPLHLLDETVTKIREGEFEVRVPVVTSDESGRLAIAFNEMNGKLNTAMADIKQKSLEIDEQRKLSDRLLRNILPKAIANRLKEEETIAEWHGQVTVLFADMVGFTKLSALLSATELVSRLNKIFTAFDELTETHGLEKIKTMGDCYMAAGGLPETREDHAEIVADLALELIPVLDEINKTWGEEVKIRIGINTGPVVAGVIGKSKFIYDLWGDAVNTASRMESHGIVGKIQVSEATYNLLSEKYDFETRGEIDVKGKGPMTTYFLSGKKGVNI